VSSVAGLAASMKQSFEIVSYVGAKPLLFEMTQSQVEAPIGPPEMMSITILGNQNASYESLNLGYSKQDRKLVHIGFSPTAEVTVFGMNPFTQKNAFRDLVRLDSCPYEYIGFIILLDLGITFTGFHDNDPSQLAVTAFARGHCDDERSKYKKFKIP
jgi:hypothetical protein